MTEMTTMDAAAIESLLAAGAVLPSGDGAAGDLAVPLTARTYRHPVLDDRPVVRLVDAALGEGEDVALDFLGLAPAADPAMVGFGPRRPLAFPEWVLVHHPADGRHALAVVPELQKLAKQIRSRPQAALLGYQTVADRFARTLPHVLPTFYEQAARVFLAAGQDTYALQLFNKARKAEAMHGLPVDLDRLDGVYLEFAAAKVVSATALAGYAKELSAQLPAGEALDRFCGLALRAAAAGVVPSAQSASVVNRLVRAVGKAAGKTADKAAGKAVGKAAGKAAGKAVGKAAGKAAARGAGKAASVGTAGAAAEREAAYLAELIRLPVAAEAPAGWWKSHLPALTALARRDPAVRGSLLDLIPAERDHLAGWLTILADTGALAGLSDTDAPEPSRPRDGSVGWLRRFVKKANSGYRGGPIEPLYPLVERMADRLRAELSASGETLAVQVDLELLDLLLALGVPVTPPAEDDSLDLSQWARTTTKRDLVALAGDERFAVALRRGVDRLDGQADTQRRMVGTDGIRPLLTDWLRARIADRFATGLPNLPAAADWLGKLPVEALRLVSAELDDALGVDLAEHVARSLRGGITEELGWPDWEQAWREVSGGDPRVTVTRQEAWPYVILGGPTTVRVLGAEGVVLRHDLRIPAGDRWGEPGYHYVDGHLLVYWFSRAHGHGICGYWHTSPGEPQPMVGDFRGREPRRGECTLPLPGGGRTTGAGVLHPGDTAIPTELPVITDGTSYWVYRSIEDGPGCGWHEYDPAGATAGPRGLPRFLADLPADADHLQEPGSWIRPALSDRATPAAVPVDGMLGWRVLTLSDGSVRGEDLAGRTVTVAPGQTPIAALVLPGDDRPRAVLNGPVLVDPDGVVTAAAGPPSGRNYTSPAIPLPGQRFFGALLPRDPAGSTALRRMDRETAAALFTAALDERRAALAAEAAAREAAARAARMGRPQVTATRTATATATTADNPPDELVELVRSTVPAISHDEVLAGVAGMLRLAVRVRTDLDAVAEHLTRSKSAPAGTQTATASGPTDADLDAALDGLRGSTYGAVKATHVFTQFQAFAEWQSASVEDEPAVRLHLDGPPLRISLEWWPLLGGVAAVAYRAVAAVTRDECRETLRALLAGLDRLGLSTATTPARWCHRTLHLLNEDLENPDGTHRRSTSGMLPLPGGAFIAVLGVGRTATGYSFDSLHYDPAGVFAVPEPYTVLSSEPVGDERPVGWLAAFLAQWAARGPLPWRPELAERFAELTGLTPTAGKLVLAGLPHLDSATTLSPYLRRQLGIGQVGQVTLANAMVRGANPRVRRAVVGALVPADPARLWTDGPDVAAAAEVWNTAVGRRVTVPEKLLTEAVRLVHTDWGPAAALPALLGPARSAELSTDLAYHIRGDRARPVDPQATGFTGTVLLSSVTLAAWVAHQTPAGEPCRAALPAALTAIQDRLANPDLLLGMDRYVWLPGFQQVAGTPSETGPGWERYGAIILATHDSQPIPALRPDLLDDDGTDPYLPALRTDAARPFPIEVALRLVRDPRFAALLGDPGDPVDGARAADGTWWPQDPSRSVPDLVAEAAGAHGLSADAATVYLMLLAMPDPTDRNTAKWTGWKPARLAAARAELAGTDLVMEASRPGAGRSLFLPGPWLAPGRGHTPIEGWKGALFDLGPTGIAGLGVTVPWEPVADLYRRAWQRLRDGDRPRLDNLPTAGTRR